MESLEKDLKIKIKELNNIVNGEEDQPEDQSYLEIDKPHQRIFFGAPGTGKSYRLNFEAEKYFNKNYERVTFHPSYMYGNFVGAYKPFPRVLKDSEGNDLCDEYGNIKSTIDYRYVPGPMIRMLVKALKNPSENYLLIVEEINRANVASVFGDIFQLLDREGNGESEYYISTSEELREFLRRNIPIQKLDDYVISMLGEGFERLKLPGNFYIWSTMNSADQGVMPMDTAFRRRWEFTYLGINQVADENIDEFNKYKMRISENEIVKWDDFRRAINKKLLACNIPEDKLIGPYFISKSILDSDDIEKLTKTIRDKVLMYIFEDAGRPYRNTIFAEGKASTYSELCKNFDENAKNVFKGTLDIETELNNELDIEDTENSEDGND